MSFDDIKILLTGKFSDDAVIGEERGGMQPALLIDPTQIVNVCRELRDNPATYFDFLSNLSGVDYGVENGRFGVVYHLASIPYQTQLTLKISIVNNRDGESLPVFPSLTSVYGAANWHMNGKHLICSGFFLTVTLIFAGSYCPTIGKVIR